MQKAEGGTYKTGIIDMLKMRIERITPYWTPGVYNLFMNNNAQYVKLNAEFSLYTIQLSS
jgi:hypothetical protein